MSGERTSADLISFGLSCAGFHVVDAVSARSLWLQLHNVNPDLVLVESRLPDSTGAGVTRTLRENTQTATWPVIILSESEDVDERIEALDSGADDYIVRPVAAREFIARIHAVLRRGTPRVPDPDRTLRIQDLCLEPASHSVSVSERPLHLPRLEYRLLEFFMRNPERAHNRSDLAKILWQTDEIFAQRTVDVHIGRLRKTLGAAGADHMLQTVRGVGYRLTARPE